MKTKRDRYLYEEEEKIKMNGVRGQFMYIIEDLLS